MKRIWNSITTLLVVLMVVLAILLVGVRLVGLEPFVILSGSMEPTHHVGALIYVKKVDPAELRPGDVITFLVKDDTVVTHRVVDVIPDDQEPGTLWFSTQGDANDTVDASLVHGRNVVGKAIFSIPYLGYVSRYIQNPPGLYVAIGVGAVLLNLAFLPDKKKKAN